MNYRDGEFIFEASTSGPWKSHHQDIKRIKENSSSSYLKAARKLLEGVLTEVEIAEFAGKLKSFMTLYRSIDDTLSKAEDIFKENKGFRQKQK